MKTEVVNIKNCPDFNAKRSRNDDNPTRNPNDVYIGHYHWDPRYGMYEKSYWHNPYRADLKHKQSRVLEKRDGTRAEIIEKFRRDALSEVAPRKTPHDILARIPELKGKRLGCWCKPEDCHGDLLANWADNGIPSH